MSYDANGKPIGIVPDVERTPMFQPIPEDELQINRKYLIEINTLNGRHIRQRYIGVLEELKSNNNYLHLDSYKFKYLECLNKNDINESEERIDGPIFKGKNKIAFLKIYNASADEDILTLDQIKAMEEIDHKKGLVEGNTYYVRYVNSSGDELIGHNAFRGKYIGTISHKHAASEYCFSNKVDISKVIVLSERSHITFYYTAEDVINFNRLRSAIDSRIPYGRTMFKNPSEFGGNKRKTNKQKRKSNKRKTNGHKNK